MARRLNVQGDPIFGDPEPMSAIGPLGWNDPTA